MTNTEAITQLHHFLYEGDTRTRTAAPKPQRQGKKPEAQDEAATAAPKPAPVKITGPTLAGSRKKRRIAYLLLGLVLLLFFPGYPVLHLANQFLPFFASFIHSFPFLPPFIHVFNGELRI